MKEEKLTSWSRPRVSRILLPLLLETKLGANSITALNFVCLCLPTVFFIATGHNLLALTCCILATLVDYVDGDVAKTMGGHTKFGAWLDTSLDWIWQLMILGAIIFVSTSPVWIAISTWALIMVVLCNYLSNVHCALDDFPFVMKYYLFFGLLFNRLDIAIYIIAWIYTFKALYLSYEAITEVKWED